MRFNQIYAFTKFAKKKFTSVKFKRNDCFLFGSETSGLPENILNEIRDINKLRIPMIKNSRSLNLSNSVSIAIYEGLRQNTFENLV